MIVLLHPDAPPDAVEKLLDDLRGLGLEPLPLDDRKGRAFEVIGGGRGQVLALRGSPAVAEILTRRTALAGGEPVWPHFVLRVAILCLVVTIALVLLAAFAPPGLGDRALTEGPAPVGTEWYLRPLEEFLGLFPARWMGGSLFLLFWISVIFWSFVDRADPRQPGGRRLALLARLLGVALLLLIVLLGVRGSL